MGILDEIKRKQLAKLHKGHANAEHHKREVQNHARQVKSILGGESPGQQLPMDVRVLKDLYYEMYKDYTGKGNTKAPLEMSARSIALWTRVADTCRQAGCDPKVYMRAQFAWFDKNFGTYPRISQLATEAAIARVQEYSGDASKRVVGAKPANIDIAEIFKRSELIVQEAMAAQDCTREEFYRRFVLTGLFTLPQAFLAADPVWRKVNG